MEDHESSRSITQEENELMKKYGIKKVSVDHFYLGDFRYTKLQDAIAQAKRGKN